MNESVPASSNTETKTPLSSTRKPVPEWIFSGVVLLIQAINFWASPGYFRPFLNAPAGQVATVIVFGWQTIGLALMCVPRSPLLAWPAVARWIIVPVFFVVPVFLVIMLGPALLTIANAIGPVVAPDK